MAVAGNVLVPVTPNVGVAVGETTVLVVVKGAAGLRVFAACVNATATVSVMLIVDVLSGLGAAVGVSVGLGVGGAGVVGCTVRVTVGVVTAGLGAAGIPVPIKITMITRKSKTEITLKKTPCVVGRSLIAKRVSRPRNPANAKWTIKTRRP